MEFEERVLGFDDSDMDSEGEEEGQNPLTAVDQEVNYLTYDYFGTRMVTCGADQRIKIWEKLDSK